MDRSLLLDGKQSLNNMAWTAAQLSTSLGAPSRNELRKRSWAQDLLCIDQRGNEFVRCALIDAGEILEDWAISIGNS